MVNINDAYTGYLKAADFQGQARNLTISHVEIKEMGDGTKKGCVFFNGVERGILLNVTNKNVLVEMFGAETDAWPGNVVCVFPSQTDFQGKVVDCIRMRRPVINQQQPAQEQDFSQQLPPAQAQAMPEAKPQDYDERNPPPADEIPF